MLLIKPDSYFYDVYPSVVLTARLAHCASQTGCFAAHFFGREIK